MTEYLPAIIPPATPGRPGNPGSYRRADHLDKLHFDIKHINTPKWEKPER
jgi:hypothetical protein